MSKRWTSEEDMFLAVYWDDIGDLIGTHDLGRPSGAAGKRVAFLKKCGAWQAMKSVLFYEKAYRKALGIKTDGDIDDDIFIRTGVRDEFKPGLRVVK